MTNKPEGLGQIKQEGISPLSPSLKSLEGKNEWTCTSERRPAPGALIVKRWKSGSVWAGIYSGTDKDSSFDEWFALPEQSSGVQTPGNSNGGKGDDLSVEEKADCGLLSELNDPDEGA